MTEDARLPIWTVYDHPTDYPGLYVARLWLNTDMTENIIMAADLETVRDQLRAMDLVCLQRAEQDDPKIIETWL